MKKVVHCLLAWAFLITIVNCQGFGKPSQATVRADFEKILAASNDLRGSTRGKFVLVDLQKTNAVNSMESGVPIYTVEFDVTLKCTQSGFPPAGLSPSGLVMKDDLYRSSDRLSYEKAEKGWRLRAS